MKIDLENCFVCGKQPQKGNRLYHADVRILVCHFPCGDVVKQVSRDFSNSKRGKWRTPKEIKRLLKLWGEGLTTGHIPAIV